MRFLVAAIVIFATPALAAPSPAPKVRRESVRKAPAKKRPPPVEMTALNTHENFVLRPNPGGRFTNSELHGWNRFLRCHHTGRSHQMASRLASLIYETSKHFNFAQVLVVAGYRAPRVAKEKGNPKSPHKKGLACDFRVEGVTNNELRDYLRGAFARVGVGYYPNSDFVHLDVRQKLSAFWVDYSHPGERARYSKSPEEDVRAEKTEPEVEEVEGETVAQNPASPQGNPPSNTEGSQPQMGLGAGVPAPNAPTLFPLTP